MACTSSDHKKQIQSFKKVELKSEHSYADPEGGIGDSNPPSEKFKIVCVLIIGDKRDSPPPSWKKLDSSGALENYKFLWKEPLNR